MPKPSIIINIVVNGVNDAKLETVLLNIYFSPLKLNKFSIVVILVSMSLFLTSITLYDPVISNKLSIPVIAIVINIKIAKEGTIIKCGDITMVQLNTDLTDENDSSQIYYAMYKNYSILFTGDASLKSEDYILDNYDLSKIDILKVGHHGSKTSTGINLIDKLEPKIALISVGKDNKFNHPNQMVLDNLKTSQIYRTDINGTITLKLNKNVKVQTDLRYSY